MPDTGVMAAATDDFEVGCDAGGCGSAPDSIRIPEVAPGAPKGGLITHWWEPAWVIGSALPTSDHESRQQRDFKESAMVSGDFHAVTVRLDVRLDVRRDAGIELAAAQPPVRTAAVATAIGNLLATNPSRPGCP